MLLKYKENLNETSYSSIELQDLQKIIVSNKYKEETNKIKKYWVDKNKTDSDLVKETIPIISTLGDSTDLMQIDIDLKKHLHDELINTTVEELESVIDDLRQTMIESNHFILIFTSPSRLGIKGIVKINKCLSKINNIEYNYFFNKVRSYIYNILYYSGLLSIDDIDESIHYKQVCFISHDEKCYINENPNPIILDSLPDYKKEDYETKYNKLEARGIEDGDIEIINGKLHCYYYGKLLLSLALISFNIEYMRLPWEELHLIIQNNYDNDKGSLRKMKKILKDDIIKCRNNDKFFKQTKNKEKIIKDYLPNIYKKYIIEDEINVDTIYIEKYLTEKIDYINNQLIEHSNIIIDSPTGSGKTTLIENLPYSKILLMEPTNTVVNNFKGNEDKGILAVTADDVGNIRNYILENQDKYKLFILTQDSGYTIRDLNFDLFVIDESHRLIKDIKHRMIVFDIQNMIRNNIILNNKQMMLSGTSMNLHNYPDFKLLKFTYNKPQKINSQSFKDRFNLFNEKIFKDKIHFIYNNNKSENNEIKQYLKNLNRNLNVIDISSDNQKDVNVLDLLKNKTGEYDVIITTCLLEDAISFNFDHDVNYYILSNNPVVIKQFSSRVRNARNVNIFHYPYKESHITYKPFKVLYEKIKKTVIFYNRAIDENIDIHHNDDIKTEHIILKNGRYHINLFAILNTNDINRNKSLTTDEQIKQLDDYDITYQGEQESQDEVKKEKSKKNKIEQIDMFDRIKDIPDERVLTDKREKELFRHYYNMVEYFECEIECRDYAIEITKSHDDKSRNNYKHSILKNYIKYLKNTKKDPLSNDIIKIYDLFISSINNHYNKTKIIHDTDIRTIYNQVVEHVNIDLKDEIKVGNPVTFFEHIYDYESKRIKGNTQKVYLNISNKCPIKEEYLRKEFKNVRI